MESSPERGVQVLKHLHPIESTSPIESFAIRHMPLAISLLLDDPCFLHTAYCLLLHAIRHLPSAIRYLPSAIRFSRLSFTFSNKFRQG